MVCWIMPLFEQTFLPWNGKNPIFVRQTQLKRLTTTTATTATTVTSLTTVVGQTTSPPIPKLIS